MKKITLLFLTLSLITVSACKKEESKQNVEDKLSQLNDTLQVSNFHVAKNYIIAAKGYIRETPEDNAKKLDSLNFAGNINIKQGSYNEGTGESYEISENEIKNGYVAVYKNIPKTNAEKPYGYVKQDILVSEYEIERYKTYFSSSEFIKLTSAQKKLILENEFHESNNFTVPQNVAKAKESIVYGDFDNDGIKDVAVTLENIEKTYGLIMILLTNQSTKKPYVAYKKSFTDHLGIRKVSAGSSVSFQQPSDDESVSEVSVFVFENDGIEVYANANPFYAIQYSNQVHKFLEHNL